jgi:molybdate/tungstate transport system substrate-binding protein
MGVVKRILLAGILLLPMIAGMSCGTGKKELLILAAGSLIVPFTEMAEQFEEMHPDVVVHIEGHGSIQVCRHTVELGDPASLSVVADYSLLPILVYSADMPGTDTPYADWSINFTGNRLGLSYTDDSAYKDEINADNWYEILDREDVSWGFSDPRLDACGYRTLMLYKLAEEHYGQGDLLQEMIIDNTSQKITVSNEGGTAVINVPEVFYSTEDTVKIRGFSVQLLSLVETGSIDYAFQYESVAKQHDLSFLELPPEIDLSDRLLIDDYRTVKVKLDYERYGTVTPEFLCEPITYGATIPASAPHPDIAAQFIEFMLGEDGQKIFTDNYQIPLNPPTVDNMDGLPESLKDLVVER